jgi:hypothetical protein
MCCEVRQLEPVIEADGTNLRDESGNGQIAAATLLVEVGDQFWFARESKSARWCDTGAVALSSAKATGRQQASTRLRRQPPDEPRAPECQYPQHRDLHDTRNSSTASSHTERPDARPTDPTSHASPTASSDASGDTSHGASNGPLTSQLDKETSDRPN